MVLDPVVFVFGSYEVTEKISEVRRLPGEVGDLSSRVALVKGTSAHCNQQKQLVGATQTV